MTKKTQSEVLFEEFLSAHQMPCECIPTAEGARRPDYLVGRGTAWGPLIFEVKELSKDDDFNNKNTGVSSRTAGDHIRAKIEESRRQIQFGAKQNCPSILLVYNGIDPMHLFGTEDGDFKAAMQGELTLEIGTDTRKTYNVYRGKRSSLGPNKNTSFSAVAHLMPINNEMTVRLYLNGNAKISLPKNLPACFQVIS